MSTHSTIKQTQSSLMELSTNTQHTHSSEDNLNEEPPMAEDVEVPSTEEDNPSLVAAEALGKFTYIEENEYKGIAEGLATQKEIMPCMCQFTAGVDSPSMACGEDSDCINRLILMECNERDCPVGEYCRNRRFQRREYAPIEIIKAGDKGYGIRAKSAIKSGTFIIEYVGEVLSKAAFFKRTRQYDEEGSRHFYFMALKHDEFIDATRRGGIGRFINHSCNPNCHVQKWVVKDRFRMGIFAKKDLAAGEELTFDYKFERFGAAAQKCLCGEPTCKGVIGIERKGSEEQPQLNLDGYVSEDEEEWDEEMLQADGKPKPKERRPSPEETDEEEDAYQTKVRAMEDPGVVHKIIKAMLHCISKPKRARKILFCLVATDNALCLRRFLQLHGLLMLRRFLVQFEQNLMFCRQILTILQKLPIQTRNIIEASMIEPVISKLCTHDDCVISALASKLISDWGALVMVYRIPKAPKRQSVSSEPLDKSHKAVESFKKQKTDQANSLSNYQQFQFYRKDSNREKRFSSPEHRRRFSEGRKGDRDRDIDLDNSPRKQRRDSTVPPTFINTEGLPPNWASARSEQGDYYYYNTVTNETQWERPKFENADNGKVDLDVSEKPMIEDVSSIDLQRIIEQARLQAEANEQADKERQLQEEKERKKRKEKAKAHLKTKLKAKELKEVKLKSVPATVTTKEATPTVATPVEKEYSTEMKKEIREEFAALVLKYFSKYKDKLEGDDFKKHARKITHILIEKESRDKEIIAITDETKRKIKKFIESYAVKLQTSTSSTSAT